MLPKPPAYQWQTKPAVRANVGTFIGISGPTGSGKTWSALELATGLAGDDRFVVIDTEHERARFYADDFTFDHCPFEPPYSSDRYASVIEHHIAKYRVIVVDSASHEYIGEGGMHDEHDRILDEMVTRSQRQAEEWKIRNALMWPAWREPKRAHKRFKVKLTALPPGHHVILCFRAEQKTELATVKDRDGREQKEVRPKEGPTGRDGWFPLCDAALPYEMTLSFLVLPGAPGLPLPIKAIPERLKPFFPLDKQISRDSGRQLAAWTRGGSQPAPVIPESQSAQPTDERGQIIAEIRHLLDGLKATATDRAAWKETYLGRPDADPRVCDMAALSDYVKFLRLRAGKAA